MVLSTLTAHLVSRRTIASSLPELGSDARFPLGDSERTARKDLLERGDGWWEMPAIFREADGLLHSGSDAKQLTGFVDGGAEAGRAREVLETQGGTIPALDASIVLFDANVEILTGLVDDLPAAHLADGFPVRRQFVRIDAGGLHAGAVSRISKETTGSGFAQCRAHHGVDQVPVTVMAASVTSNSV